MDINNTIRSSQALKKTQKGYSIIELMITLVLSMVVVLGVYTTLTSNQTAYTAVTSNQVIVDKSRTVSNILRTMLQQSGNKHLRQLQIGLGNSVFMPENINLGIPVNWQQNQRVFGIDGGGAINDTASDGVGIRFFTSNFTNQAAGPIQGLAAQDDSPVLDCNGLAITDRPTPISMAFFIAPDPNAANPALNTLNCIDSITNTPVVIATNILSMQIFYGFDNINSVATNPALATMGYVRANSATLIGDPSLWQFVNRIKIAILVSEDLRRGSAALSTLQNHTVLDKTITIAANRREITQVIDQTVFLNN